MAIRITPHRQLETGRLYARWHADQSAILTNQIASGVRVHKPSDDPHATKRILDYRAIGSHYAAQSSTIDGVRSILNDAHSQIRSAQQQVVSARDVALQVLRLDDPVAAKAFAQEISATLKSLEVIANTRSNGHYLFSGNELATQPYGDLSVQSDYQGGANSGSIQIAGAGSIKTYYSGDDVFQTGLGGSTVVRGNTGAAGGVGTASGPGRSSLIVEHTTTVYAGASGIQPGSRSPGGDTVIGQTGTHQLQVIDTSGTGSAGTISLNGGDAIAFTSADTDLAITGPNGEIVYVDTTAIAAGFSGTVDFEANGTVSLDGGLTNVPIDFSQTQTLVDEQGNVRHLDTRGIDRSGIDTVSMTGNSDIFETLRSLRDDLLNFESFTTVEWTEAVGQHLNALNHSHDHLLDIVGEQSVDLQTLDRLQERGNELKFEAEKVLAELEGTDFTEAVLRLQESQNMNQFTLAALANVFQVSILDYLR
ncbi:MAG: flagellar hook-associated protein FlgL [Planctomycetaceae bacterium]